MRKIKNKVYCNVEDSPCTVGENTLVISEKLCMLETYCTLEYGGIVLVNSPSMKRKVNHVMERALPIVSIFFIVVILVLIIIIVVVIILIIMPDDIAFLPQWAGASCFLLLPFTPTCVAEFIAAPATTNVRSSRHVSKIL